MPVDLWPTPEVTQHRLNQALQGLPGIRIVADSILIVEDGDSKEEAIHDHVAKLR